MHAKHTRARRFTPDTLSKNVRDSIGRVHPAKEDGDVQRPQDQVIAMRNDVVHKRHQLLIVQERTVDAAKIGDAEVFTARSEERRVGKEYECGWLPSH